MLDKIGLFSIIFSYEIREFFYTLYSFLTKQPNTEKVQFDYEEVLPLTEQLRKRISRAYLKGKFDF